MTNRTKDRLTWAVLAIVFILLVAALIGLVIWADTQINRWENKAIELESELADTRAEKGMWQGELKALVEGETNSGINFETREED